MSNSVSVYRELIHNTITKLRNRNSDCLYSISKHICCAVNAFLKSAGYLSRGAIWWIRTEQQQTKTFNGDITVMPESFSKENGHYITRIKYYNDTIIYNIVYDTNQIFTRGTTRCYTIEPLRRKMRTAEISGNTDRRWQSKEAMSEAVYRLRQSELE